DAMYRMIAQIADSSAAIIPDLINDKQFAKHQPVENCLLLFDITGDEVFLRHALRFAERSRIPGGDVDNITNVRKLQSRMPTGHALLFYHAGDTALTTFLVSKNTFKHALVNIDTNFNKDVQAFCEYVK